MFATRPDNKDADGLPCASLVAAARGVLFGPIPVAQVRVALGGAGNRLSNLPTILDQPEYNAQERHWNKAPPQIVEGMASLVQNYPPESGTAYTQSEVENFQLMASLPQLIYHGHRALVEQELKAGRAVDLDAFPSLKAMTYTVFHKFYADRSRKPLASDAFGVLIASTLPYVEAFITESHQAEVIRKTKRRDGFLDGLHVFTLRDFRNGPPVRAATSSPA